MVTTLRRLLMVLSGLALLVAGLLIGASSPVAAGDGAGCTGDVVVTFDVRLLARAGEDVADQALTTPVGPGVYRVTTLSADSYDGRATVQQTEERWTVEFLAAGRSIGPLGPTTDVPDGVDAASVADELGTVTIDQPIDRLRARHYLAPQAGGTDSVGVVCVGLVRIDSPDEGLRSRAFVDCATDEVVVSVANHGAVAAYADIVAGASAPVRVEVPAGALVDRRFTIGAPITGVSVRAVADGRAVLDSSLDSRCASPSPSPDPTPPPTPPPAPGAGPTVPTGTVTAAASVECATSEVVVALTNRGGSEAVVDVAVPGSAVVSDIEVGSGSEARARLTLAPDLEDTVAEIRVLDSSSGDLHAAADFVVDCLGTPDPTADFVVDCARGTVVVSLTNQGGAPAELTVIHERVEALDPVVVEGGAEAHVELDVTDSRLALRVVDGAGADVVREAVDTSCAGITPDDAIAADEAEDGGPSPADGGDVGAGPDLAGEDRVECTGAAGEDPSACEPSLHVAILIECELDRARVELGRYGIGRERAVVLADGSVVDVVEVASRDLTVVFVPVEDSVEITISRADVGELAARRRVSCGNDDLAGSIAASLVVVAVLASAAGVLPWPTRRFGAVG